MPAEERAQLRRPARARRLRPIVSHSSRRRRVTTRRTSVIAIACSRSDASLAMKASCSPTARGGRLQILGRRAQEDAPRLPAARTAQDLECEDDAGKRERRQAGGRPHQRVARQDGPAEHEQEQRRRRHQAAPEVVEDLPSRDERQTIALHAGPRRHERKQPPTGSASRRAPSGAAAARGRGRWTG